MALAPGLEHKRWLLRIVQEYTYIAPCVMRPDPTDQLVHPDVGVVQLGEQPVGMRERCAGHVLAGCLPIDPDALKFIGLT